MVVLSLLWIVYGGVRSPSRLSVSGLNGGISGRSNDALSEGSRSWNVLQSKKQALRLASTFALGVIGQVDLAIREEQ